MDSVSEFFTALAAGDAYVAELYECHLENNHGLLSHVFMGELLQALEDSHLGLDEADLDVVEFLRSLEVNFNPDDLVVLQVVVTSFLLDLPHPPRPGYAPTRPGYDLINMLGP